MQLKTDYFIANSPLVKRYYDDSGYSTGQYRMYRMVCDNDTLVVDIVFSGNDSLSRIGVSFFN
jgi:hypothetical protein